MELHEISSISGYPRRFNLRTDSFRGNDSNGPAGVAYLAKRKPHREPLTEVAKNGQAHRDGPSDRIRSSAAGVNSHKEFGPLVLLVAGSSKRREQLQRIVTQAGYEVELAPSGREALRLLRLANDYRIVMLCEVHDLDIVSMCRQIKEWETLTSSASIIVLQDRFKADHVVECLMSGASDYISGPHYSDERVLLARLHVAVRGYHLSSDDRQADLSAPVLVGPLTINTLTFRVTVAEQGEVKLTKLQFHILCRLARRPGRVFLHDELRRIISDFAGGDPTDQTIKSHMSNLRKRLGGAGRFVKTVRGVGYALQV